MGNASRRKLETRLRQIALMEIQSSKPGDLWLSLASIAVGIMFYLLPKTTIVTVIALISIFVLLIHPIWNFWWVERYLHRRLISLAVLGILLVGLGFYVWPQSERHERLFDPIIHLEPERTTIKPETGKPGLFKLSLVNSGLEDIDRIDVSEDYFVALKGQTIIIKNMGGVPVTNEMKSILKGGGDSDTIRIDFSAHIDIMNEVAANFKGPSLRGVKVTVNYRRRADGADFSITRGYGLFGKGAEMFVTVNSVLDNFPMELRDQFLSLQEVVALFQSPDHWTAVTKEIGSTPNGQQTIRHY